MPPSGKATDPFSALSSPCLPLRGSVNTQSRGMHERRGRDYNVVTPEGCSRGSSEAGQNRQLKRDPSRQAAA